MHHVATSTALETYITFYEDGQSRLHRTQGLPNCIRLSSFVVKFNQAGILACIRENLLSNLGRGLYALSKKCCGFPRVSSASL